MKVAVIGGWKGEDRQKWNLKEEEKFSFACKSLGKEIARLGHSLLVTSDVSDTADYSVVIGFTEQLAKTEITFPRIHVYRLAHSPPAFKDLAEIYPNLFNFSEEEQPNWVANLLILVRDADVVIGIGGGNKTHNSLLAAIIADKNVVPVGSFGGAGQKILHEIRNMRITQDDIDITGLENPWDSSVLYHVLEQSGILDYPKIFIVHGSSNDSKDLYQYLRNKVKLRKIIEMRIDYGQSRTLPEKFEQLASKADASIIVVTPDDIGGKVASDTGEVIESNYRARQNVWLEIGWFWARLGRKRFMILKRGKIEQPTDIQGIEYFDYEDKPSDLKDDIDSFIRFLRK